MTLPPYAILMGIALVPQAEGPPGLTFPWEPERIEGRPGFLHGGAIAGLLEMAALVALRHALAETADMPGAPIASTIDYLRAGRDKPTQAVGIVTRLGSRIANVEAVAWQDSRDAPIAAARMNWRIVRS